MKLEILDVIALFEKALGRKAVIELKPGEPGDMPETAADIDAVVAVWTELAPALHVAAEASA